MKIKETTKLYCKYVLVCGAIISIPLSWVGGSRTIILDDMLYRYLFTQALAFPGIFFGLLFAFKILKFDILTSKPIKTYLLVPITTILVGTLSYFVLGYLIGQLGLFFANPRCIETAGKLKSHCMPLGIGHVSDYLLLAIVGFPFIATIPALIGNFFIVIYLRKKFGNQPALDHSKNDIPSGFETL